MLGFGGALREEEAGSQGRQRYPQWENPLGRDRYLGAGQGWQGGVGGVIGESNRRRHTAQGVETSGGGWGLAVAVKFQVGGASRQERTWVAGDTNK